MMKPSLLSMVIIYVAKLRICCFLVSLSVQLCDFENICEIHHVARRDTSCASSQRIGYARLGLNCMTALLRVCNSLWRSLMNATKPVRVVSLVAHSFPPSDCNALTTCIWRWHLSFITHTHSITSLCDARRTYSLLWSSKHQKTTYKSLIWAKRKCFNASHG